MFSNPRFVEALRRERYPMADRSEPADMGWYRPQRGAILRMVWPPAPWWKALMSSRASTNRGRRSSS